MKTRLDQIEERLRSLIEGSASLLARGDLQQHLAHRLVEAIQANITTGPDGRSIAPGEYTIFVHPDLYAYWQTHLPILDTVARSMQEAAREYGIFFLTDPRLNLAPDPGMNQDDLRVVVRTNPDTIGQTAVFPPQALAIPKNAVPNNAFLILDGKILPLTQSVINIGRRSDNHIVIPDPRVSRAHAQMRAVRGQYVLFDLNSTGGTTVNGRPIHQYTLKPGDVISLSGVPLIYGEDAPGGSEGDEGGNTRTIHITPPPPEVLG